jgi:hypothetical protein
MNKKKMMIGSALLIAVLVVWFLAVVPEFEKLPGDYNLHVNLLSSEQTRYDVGAELSKKDILKGFIKLDTTSSNKKSAFIDEVFHIEYLDGTLSYETLADYEVDRNTHQIIGGDTFFMFPPKLKKQDYVMQFPGWSDPVTVKFKEETAITQLGVYRYETIIKDLDLTPSFEFLDLVPETYDVVVDAVGTYWVEPTTGILIKYEEEGTNHYITKDKREKVQEFSLFSNSFSDDTITSQALKAQNEKFKLLLIRVILPVLFAIFIMAVTLFLSLREDTTTT